MSILVVTETLLAGGAEWFVLRLCKSLADRGHHVTLYILRPNLVDERLTKNFKDIRRKHLPIWKVKTAAFIDRIFNKLGISFSYLEELNSADIRRHIIRTSPDVIHSHLLPCDLTALKANEDLGVRHVTTIHGDYIQVIKGQNGRMEKNIKRAAAALDSVVVISDEQASMLASYSAVFRTKMNKIYNGYPTQGSLAPSGLSNTFNFGMIARAIPEKGWEPAIKAFIKLRQTNVRLYLYGEGKYLAELQNKYTDPRIIFAGFSDQPLLAIQNMHVGLLPSYYPAESLPTTIIEYLAMSKPVIVSSAGEIPKMIETETMDLAGILIDQKDPQQMVEPIYQAMNKLMTDTALYENLAVNCESAFRKFSMDKCLEAYLSIYKSKTRQKCVA